MNKEQYIEKLKELLKTLPQEEIDNAVEYVDEYFFEAGEENFEQAMEDLGSPQKFAAQVKAEYTIKSNEVIVKPYSKPLEKDEIKKGNASIWTIIFGILSLPISLPLLIVVLALLLVGFILVTLPIFILFILVISFIAVSFWLLRHGITIFAISISSGLLMLAGFLMMLGLTGICIVLLITIVGKLIPWIIKKLGELYKKLKGDASNE